MSELNDFSEDAQKIVAGRELKIRQLIMNIQKNNEMSYMSPNAQLEIKISSLIGLLIEKDIISEEDFALTHTKTQIEYLEAFREKVGEVKDVQKIIIPGTTQQIIKP